MKSMYSGMAFQVSRGLRRSRRFWVTTLALAATTLGYAADAVSTLAGSALQAGYVNETGGATRFRFSAVAGAAVDSAGNLYVADAQNNAIRKITPAGAVTTFAGSTSGTAGAANGTGTNATFSSPVGVAIDGADNLYVADTGNHLIRKITSAGDVTTVAGSGTAGYTNGTGTGAEFRSPMGVAVPLGGGAATTLFVADSQNSVIRRIDLGTGTVSNVAGSTSGVAGWADSTDADARFSGPVALLAAAGGTTLYVADTGNHDVRKIVISGGVATVTTLAGTDSAGYVNGTGADARFTAPRGLAFDGSGNLLVADSGTQTVRKVTTTGAVTLLAGTPSAAGAVDALATDGAKLNGPSGLAVSGAVVYVVDSGNETVRQISAAAAPASRERRLFEHGLGLHVMAHDAPPSVPRSQIVKTTAYLVNELAEWDTPP